MTFKSIKKRYRHRSDYKGIRHRRKRVKKNMQKWRKTHSYDDVIKPKESDIILFKFLDIGMNKQFGGERLLIETSKEAKKEVNLIKRFFKRHNKDYKKPKQLTIEESNELEIELEKLRAKSPRPDKETIDMLNKIDKEFYEKYPKGSQALKDLHNSPFYKNLTESMLNALEWQKDYDSGNKYPIRKRYAWVKA